MQSENAGWLKQWEALLAQSLVKVRSRLAAVTLKTNPDNCYEPHNMIKRPLTVQEASQIRSEWEKFKQHSRLNRTDALLNWARNHVSDISTKSAPYTTLFDFMRVQAAIYEVDPQGKEFQLVLGDLSGIQSYLFAIARTGEGGVARRLRARSFKLGLMAQSAAVSLIERLQLSPASILMSSGGIFMLVLPKMCPWHQWKDEMDQYLYHTFQGELQLHMASVEVGQEQVESISELTSELHSLVQKEKSRPFASFLQQKAQWLEKRWIHEHTIPTDDDLIEEQLGRRLPQAIGVQLVPMPDESRISTSGHLKLWGNLEVHLLTSHSAPHPDAVWTEYWNGNTPSFLTPSWVQASGASNYVPTVDGQTMTFVDMAEIAEGKNALGVLKADIDHLGLLLSFGLRRDRNNYSLYEYMYISRELQFFTSEIIMTNIISQFPRVYTVFSGGDDLFFIGPWSEMPGFAWELNEQFRLYVENNKEVTLSAALLFVSPKTPMATIAHMAEESLADAKDIANMIRKKEQSTSMEGRNQICLNGQIMEWEHLRKAWDKAKEWSEWLRQGGCTHALLRKLIQIAAMRHAFTANGKVEGLRYQSLLAYTINRFPELQDDNKAKLSQEECRRWLVQLRGLDNIEVETWWALMPSIYRLFYLMQERGETSDDSLEQ